MHDRAAKIFIDNSHGKLFADRGGDGQMIHPVDRHVGQQLRILRIHSNLSQTELGHEVGLSYQQVQKYESGKNRISASMLYVIASRLNVPVNRFFDGLPPSESEVTDGIVPEVDERIAYIATAEGRRFVEEILRLPPRLRTRTLAVIKVLAGDEEETAGE
ncbi:helix-turn-helix transcriptional regulator [Agrobacterium rhizogenes]|uniref:helix-turn-helix domain-containing protein n=1 Tax=Rhizobium rhizogenes TaxID=359 RepID=UPI001574081C|nr:helix-turn-helix transcriptional regulator [Rhizobium rhizogenes]NTH65931.1 helix-turn-helix transcriptional regulator [Rhizobium rhizogenes]NTH79006.1 helix-turn-helix transcriptional regulator [Rhizobium rhizogenes]NTH85011.1 helix-turn-helix transcriptional regulator [Rhizobium rhizogenes]